MDYSESAKQLVQKAKQTFTENDWTLYSEIDGVKIESKLYPECPISCFRATGLVNTTPEKLFNVVKSFDEGIWRTYDPDIIKWENLENVEASDTKIILQINKLPWPLWSRKGVSAITNLQDNDSYWIVGRSVEHPNSPEDPKNYVTAKVHMAIYGFVPENGVTRVWRFFHVDPSGNIPSFVVDANAQKLSTIIKDLMNRNYE